ncbi:hypothetical protein [Alkalihalobacterium sp. APHAB7]|uniref:hypothetical protein n=1 Tax=Alkalihalobacterium sp. APHAB7 TaxID=3402081 RepID=UPI003AAA4A8C
MKKRIMIGFSCLVIGLMLQGNYGTTPSNTLNEKLSVVAMNENLTTPTELPSEH